MTSVPTRERILDAAERLFFNDGITVTGVDRVADSAGVAIATLYNHVGSKEGLVEAVLSRRLDAWREHWDAAVAAAGSPDERLVAVFDAVVSYRQAAVPTQWCCFLATASERPRGAGSDPVRALLDQDTSLLTERLQELAGAAQLDDPDGVAAQLLLLYNGALTSLLRGTPDRPVERARRLAQVVVETSTRSG